MPTVSGGEVGRDGAVTRDPAAAIAAEMERMRGRTLALVEPLAEAALRRQVRDFLSPLLWDLGHIADFERVWLVDAVRGRSRAGLQRVFDAQETPRSARRGEILPGKDEALKGLRAVRREALRLLDRAALDGDDALLRDGFIYHMVLQHEAQHQETMLQSLDIPAEEWGYCRATLAPSDGTVDAASSDTAAPAPDAAAKADDEARVRVPAGSFVMGTEDRSRAYDNERRSHRVRLDAFEIERYPVTNRRWRQFVADDGYRRDALWSPEGVVWRRDNGIRHPQGWIDRGDRLSVRRFGRERALDPLEPVQHVSFWEAEAFAAWAGGRLPRESEWEKAVTPEAARPEEIDGPRDGRGDAFRPLDELDRGAAGAVSLDRSPDTSDWGPPRVGRRPRLASAYGVEDAFGSVYQWTVSPFRPYPGFAAFPYRGYSEVFFGDTYRVLRGTSWAADVALWRRTYRNWDFPHRRQIFSGVRLVYDV